MEDEYVRKDYYNATIRRIEVQEAMNANIDDKLDKIRATVNEVRKIVDDMNCDINRWGITIIITLSIVQITVSLLIHRLM